MNKIMAAFLILAATTFAQEPGTFEMGNRISLLRTEALPVQAIAGAPFSAEETTTTTQTLVDSNRIVTSSTTKVYRDEQGRTRVEHTIENIGSLPAGRSSTTITINDPVSHTSYTLEPDSRIAIKASGATGSQVDIQKALKSLAEMKAQLDGKRSELKTAATPARNIENRGKTEDLGSSNMAGVQVKGTRSTTVIPAGTIGNDREINIVSERWYSPDLKMNIMTKHSDPRSGDTVFRVNNLTRSNPDPSLFQVPADFQVKENPKVAAEYKFLTIK